MGCIVHTRDLIDELYMFLLCSSFCLLQISGHVDTMSTDVFFYVVRNSSPANLDPEVVGVG